MLTQDTIIIVYNENHGKVYCPSQNNTYGYTFGEIEDGIPFEIPMPLHDIRYINSRSAVFRDGILRIEEGMEEEVFKSIGIIGRSDNFISYEEIEKIIIHPTVEGLERFLRITSIVTMDKVRNVLVKLDNSDEYDIATRVFDVINGRYAELNVNKKKSEIIIKRKKNEEETKKVSKSKSNTNKE